MQRTEEPPDVADSNDGKQKKWWQRWQAWLVIEIAVDGIVFVFATGYTVID